MTTLPLRHPKLWAVLFALSILSTVYKETYLAFLGEWLPLVGFLVFMSFIMPVNNKLESLKLVYKGPIFALGVSVIVWEICGLFDLHRPLFDVLDAFVSR